MTHAVWLLASLGLTACADKATWSDAAEVIVDADGDGYPSTEDCDDDNPDVWPGAAEVCNGVDDDCDPAIDEEVLTTYFTDSDDDGFGDLSSPQPACERPAGAVANSTDCDDGRADVNPGGTEVCDDSDTHEDCDGLVDEDDPDSSYADDLFGDGIDNDCDGQAASVDMYDTFDAAANPFSDWSYGYAVGSASGTFALMGTYWASHASFGRWYATGVSIYLCFGRNYSSTVYAGIVPATSVLRHSGPTNQ